jgi:hypothetical protein
MRMLAGNRRFFNLAFLIIFFTVTATISVCHTETGLKPDPSCPACSFQSTCLATAVIHFYQPPVISPVEIMDYSAAVHCIDEVAPNFASRSPPMV